MFRPEIIRSLSSFFARVASCKWVGSVAYVGQVLFCMLLRYIGSICPALAEFLWRYQGLGALPSSCAWPFKITLPGNLCERPLVSFCFGSVKSKSNLPLTSETQLFFQKAARCHVPKGLIWWLSRQECEDVAALGITFSHSASGLDLPVSLRPWPRVQNVKGAGSKKRGRRGQGANEPRLTTSLLHVQSPLEW